jgi:hypothetical protein
MDCGYVYFGKSIGDTIISYYIDIDCNPYKGKAPKPQEILDYIEIEEEEMIPISNTTSNKDERIRTMDLAEIDGRDRFKEQTNENPYYPFEISHKNDLKDCFIKVDNKTYEYLSDNIDSLTLIKFIEQHNGEEIYGFSNWNSETGGTFLVRNKTTFLLFPCTITKGGYNESDSSKWTFNIRTPTPIVDQKSLRKKIKREDKINSYYNLE